MNDTTAMESTRSRLLQAALPHVPFDGWSEATLTAAITDSQTPPALARALFPRGGIDMALAYHAADALLMPLPAPLRKKPIGC